MTLAFKSKLSQKRIRKAILLLMVRYRHTKELTCWQQFPLIQNDLSELMETGFLKKDNLEFVFTEKGQQITDQLVQLGCDQLKGLWKIFFHPFLFIRRL